MTDEEKEKQEKDYLAWKEGMEGIGWSLVPVYSAV
jgi:hypothetical protein